jgi:DNA invertase Pin-like site-specific DNA recombinase
MKYGYARVSTEEQKTHAQTDALTRYGCTVIFQEKRSGANMARPELQKLLSGLKKGDEVVIYKLDRIARSLRDLLTIEDKIHQSGATLHTLTEYIDTRSPTGRMIFQILGAVAEFERALISERTIAGLKAAVERGAKPGRVPAISAAQLPELAAKFASGTTKAALSREYGCDISSVKRALARAAKIASSEPAEIAPD